MFSFVSLVHGDISKNIYISKSHVKEFTAYIFFQGFVVLGLTCRSLIHFEFVLVYGTRKWSSVIVLHVSVPCKTIKLSQHCLYLFEFVTVNPQIKYILLLAWHLRIYSRFTLIIAYLWGIYIEYLLYARHCTNKTLSI